MNIFVSVSLCVWGGSVSLWLVNYQSDLLKVFDFIFKKKKKKKKKKKTIYYQSI